jgi:hypothetical protein
MASLISRVRILINDPSSAILTDQTVQDVLDESRIDVYNAALTPKLTYAPTIQFLDYFSELGGWEDDYVLKQYLTNIVTASSVEPIAGHFHFSASTYPPVYITGKLYDIYRAAADLLERMAAQYALQFAFSSDGQSFHPEQIQDNIDKLVRKYRMKQRPGMISMRRSDLALGASFKPTLKAGVDDYIVSGD